MDESMRNVILMFGGIALFGGIVALLDWLARRKDQPSEKRPTA